MIHSNNNRLASLGMASVYVAGMSLALLFAATRSRNDLLVVGWILLYAVIAFATIRMLVLLQKWTLRYDIFSPIVGFPVAFVAWFTFGSIDWIELPSIFNFGLFDPIPPQMWWYYGLGLFGFATGVLLLRSPISLSQLSLLQNDWIGPRALKAFLCLSFVVFVSWSILTWQFGVPGLSSSPSEARLHLHGPFYLVFVISSWVLLIIAPLIAWGADVVRKQQLLVAGSSAATLLLLASMAGRSNIFVPLLTMLIVSHAAKSRLELRRFAIILAVLFFAMSIMGYVRDFAQSEDSLDWLTVTGIPEPMLPIAYAGIYVRYSVATFRDVTQMIPAHVPYQYGAVTLAPFRTFLPGHQEMSDVFFKKISGNDFVGAGQPATLLGPLYADFGVWGVFFGMASYGLLVQFLYRRMRNRPSPLRIILYAWVLQSGLFGLFATIFPYVTSLLIPLTCWALDRYIRDRQPAPKERYEF